MGFVTHHVTCEFRHGSLPVKIIAWEMAKKYRAALGFGRGDFPYIRSRQIAPRLVIFRIS